MKIPSKQTKIVATIGPASESEDVLKQMILAGMNVARFNVKHSNPEWHLRAIAKAKKVAKELGIALGILVDLQGPEIRINLPEEKSIDAKKGDIIIFTHDIKKKVDKVAFLPKQVIKDLSTNDRVSFDDGACELKIVKKGRKYFKAEVLNSHVMKHRKTLNTPGIEMHMPSLINRDYAMLDVLKDGDADFIGLSFVRDAKDIKKLKKEMAKRRLYAAVISKIENQKALDNLDEIIDISDGIMIARGDLAVEVAFEQLSLWQKTMIRKCRKKGKPVITATQMLESMIYNPTPTRAEVSDVANAIYDKTDAVMLSGETTIGAYPVKCVVTQAKIAQFNEQHAKTHFSNYVNESDPELSVPNAAAYLLSSCGAAIKTVVCLSETGETAVNILRTRPKIPVHVVTNNKKTFARMSIYYGAIPHLVDLKQDKVPGTYKIIDQLSKEAWFPKNQRILITHGRQYLKAGGTNTLTVVNVH